MVCHSVKWIRSILFSNVFSFVAIVAIFISCSTSLTHSYYFINIVYLELFLPSHSNQMLFSLHYYNNTECHFINKLGNIYFWGKFPYDPYTRAFATNKCIISFFFCCCCCCCSGAVVVLSSYIYAYMHARSHPVIREYRLDVNFYDNYSNLLNLLSTVSFIIYNHVLSAIRNDVTDKCASDCLNST